MPPLPGAEPHVPLPAFATALAPQGSNALTGLLRALSGRAGVPAVTVAKQLFISLLPMLVVAGLLAVTYQAATAPEVAADTSGLVQAGGEVAADIKEEPSGLVGGLQEPEEEGAEAKEGATLEILHEPDPRG